MAYPGSEALRSGLAVFTGIAKESDYCDIADRFRQIADDYLAGIKAKVKRSTVKWPQHVRLCLEQELE